ncbi:hypothetical protein G6F60_002365 [Rhizopus arrhizus]|nr:hypothetical protein G6F61_012277 [Rhizopus arrhizus]KAG1407210.1 hypothetical protein G6F60_002365 [Rhizopus arrhizus]
MTIQVRSKRRILPKRSIVDVDFISPTTHNLQDLLLNSIPSKKDYSVINQLFGGEEKTKGLPQVVVGRPQRREKEDALSSFFDQHSIIPLGVSTSSDVKRSSKKQATDVRHGELSLSTKETTKEDEGQKEPTTVGDKRRVERKQSTSLEPVIVIEQGARKRSRDKKRPKASFMVPPSKRPKRPRTHHTIKILKESNALDWVVNGKDQDPRKSDVGIVRKRQLQARLGRSLMNKKSRHQGIWRMKQ